eukprot:7468241-Karenia_brevis.AAC.1
MWEVWNLVGPRLDDEEEEEEFQDCREIHSLVDSSSSEEDNVPSKEDLERMRRITGGRVRRERRTVFRESRVESCNQSCCRPESQKERFIGGVESKPQGQRMRLNFQVADVAKPLLAVKRI